MITRNPHRAIRAFSLVEMAMVIAIAGLMLSFGLKSQQASAPGADCYVAAKLQLTTIRTAIETFARKNDRLPFPAALSAKVEGITYGREDTTGTQTTVVGTGANAATWGALPFQTLGLAPSFASDCWGNKIVYIVTNYMTNNSNTNGYLDGNVVGTITLKNSTTNITNSNIAYAVISLGEDGLGAVKANSSATPWCTYTSANISTYNCSPSASTTTTTIADAVFNNGKNAGANYFDDVIIAAGKPQIPYTTNLYCWGTDSAGGGVLADGSFVASHHYYAPSQAHSNYTFAKFADTDDSPTAGRGANVICGLGVDGTAYCWGSSSGYGVGDGVNASRSVPTAVAGTIKFKNIMNQGGYTTGIGLTDNKIYCWGGPTYGACIPGNITMPTAFTGAVTFQYNVPSADFHYGCGLGTDSQAYCWSVGGEGARMGRGNVNQNDAATGPIAVSGGHRFSKLVMSPDDVDWCGLTNAADAGGADYLYCWGLNSYGTAGLGDQIPHYVPTVIPGHTFSNVFAGMYSMYGVADAADANPNRLYAWGLNVQGTIGIGGISGADWGTYPNSSLTPYTVTNIDKHSPGTVTTASPHGFSNGDLVAFYTDPSIGITGTAGLLISGQNFQVQNVTSTTFQLYSADGSNYTIESATGNYAATTTISNITQANPPVVTTTTAHGYTNGMTVMVINVAGMTAINQHIYTVENVTATTFELWTSTTVPADSTAYGAYTSGGKAGEFQLVAKKPNGCYVPNGNSFGICKASPTLVDMTNVSPSTLFTNIVRQNNSSLALTSDGTLYGWGMGWDWQLGNVPGSYNATVVKPVKLGTTGPVIRKIVNTGPSIGCALGVDKNLYCWGDSGYGVMGSGGTAAITTPTKVAGTNQYIDFDMPIQQTVCGIRYDPTVDCDTTAITWGACSATSWAMVNGSSNVVTNTTAGHTGTVTVSCTNKVLTQTGGSCM